MQNNEQEGGAEVLDTNKVLKTPLASLLFFVAISIFCFLMLGNFIGIDMNPYFYLLFLPMAGSILWLSKIYEKARLAFWKTVATKYGWKYLPFKEVSDEKGLVFNMGHSRMGYHSISGEYLAHPFELFEYRFITGYGKSQVNYYFTVFEVKFTGTFPHLYLNYKNDLTKVISFPFNMANISLPVEFAKIFKLYSPKEYEIETLQVFTPDVLASLLNLGWDYDMEFVDGELLIYKSKTFTNFTDLDTEVKRVRQIVDLLAPQLNKMKLSKIGDFSPELK